MVEITDNPNGEIKTIDLQVERQKKKPGKVDPILLATKLDDISKEFAVVQRGSQILIMRHWRGQDGKQNLSFFTRRDFLLLLENKWIKVENSEGETETKQLGKLWLSSTRRRDYDEIYFRPDDTIVPGAYNLWRGFGIVPQSDKGTFIIFLDHVKNNICGGNPDYYAWVMAFLADLFQKPGRKPGTALVLRGPMGIGKGVFADIVGKLLGIHYCQIFQGSQLTGRFNAHMADKMLVFVDESFWSNERGGEGIIRGLITEHKIPIEMKMRDLVMMDNYTRFIIAANADWAVKTGMYDERRFAVLDVGIGCLQDHDYFIQMRAEMDNGGYEALLDYLLKYSYDESLVFSIPKTEALLDQKVHSLLHEIKWVHSILENGRIGEQKLYEEDENWMFTEDFYNAYIMFCEKTGKREPHPDNILTRKINKAMVTNNTQKLTSEGKRRIYKFDKLSVMRQKFADHLGHEIAWKWSIEDLK